MVTFEQPFPQNPSKPKKKRPASGGNIPSAIDRMIQPQQPSNFASVNPSSDPATDQGATDSLSGGPPKKKRGRPSKAEYEAKVAEAAARGEEYHPPPKRKKTPRPSLQGAPNPGMVTPSVTDISAVGEGSIGKKNARKPTAVFEEASSLTSGPPVRNLALEVTAHDASQMQYNEDKPVKSTMPEAQASEVKGRESAENNAPDTFQSMMTFQHGPTPQTDFTYYQGPTGDPATTGEQQDL